MVENGGKKGGKSLDFAPFGKFLKKIIKNRKKVLTNRKLFDIIVKHLRGLNSVMWTAECLNPTCGCI